MPRKNQSVSAAELAEFEEFRAYKASRKAGLVGGNVPKESESVHTGKAAAEPVARQRPASFPKEGLSATLYFHDARETAKGKPYIVCRMEVEGIDRDSYVTIWP